MGKNNKGRSKEKLIKLLKEANRAANQELLKLRSKTWDNLPSNRETRHLDKQRMKDMIRNKDYEQD